MPPPYAIRRQRLAAYAKYDAGDENERRHSRRRWRRDYATPISRHYADADSLLSCAIYAEIADAAHT